MVTETFKFKAEITTAGEGEFITERSDFGDGYSQETAIGLANDKQKWTLVFSGNEVEVGKVLTFIRNHKGANSFFWKPPLGVTGKYRCKRYTPRPLGAGIFSLTLEFQEA